MDEQGGLELLINVETEQPLVAVTAASEIEIPLGKSI